MTLQRTLIGAISAAAFVAAVAAIALQRTSADAAAKMYPNAGWTIHIDAKKHFANHPNEIAHHFCRPAKGGMIECQLYESDAPNARMIGAETIVMPAVYKAFSPAEQARWHYHKTEIPKVSATTPDMTPAQAKKLVADLTETYGKVYILWDPMTSDQPLGDPAITILK
jgi:hypothetical protein